MLLIAVVTAVSAFAGSAVADAGRERTPRDLNPSSCNVVKLNSRAHVLYRRDVSCSFAKRWVKRLAATRGRSKPSGWACSSGSSFRTGGYCERGSRHFGWHPLD